MPTQPSTKQTSKQQPARIESNIIDFDQWAVQVRQQMLAALKKRNGRG